MSQNDQFVYITDGTNPVWTKSETNPKTDTSEVTSTTYSIGESISGGANMYCNIKRCCFYG